MPTLSQEEIDAAVRDIMAPDPVSNKNMSDYYYNDDPPIMVPGSGVLAPQPAPTPTPVAQPTSIPPIKPKVVADIDEKINQGADPSSLTNAEKIALGTLALAPILGGLLGGHKGALAGAAAGSKGLGAWGQQVFKEKELLAKASKKKDEKSKDIGKDIAKIKLGLEKREAFKKFTKVEDASRKLVKFSQSTEPLTDYAAIQTVLKVLDEASVAREAEVANVKLSVGWQDKWKNLLAGLKGKSALQPSQKRAMRQIAKTIMEIQAINLKKDIDFVRAASKQFGANPDDVITQDFADQTVNDIFGQITDADSLIEGVKDDSEEESTSSGPGILQQGAKAGGQAIRNMQNMTTTDVMGQPVPVEPRKPSVEYNSLLKSYFIRGPNNEAIRSDRNGNPL